jgi:hypothetical protein
VRFRIRERFLGLHCRGSLVFPRRVPPLDRLCNRRRLPPSVTDASLRLLFEDSLGFTRPFFCCSKLPQLPGSSHRILSKTAPPSSHLVCPLPANRGPGLPLPEHVPSLSFLPTPTAYSTRGLTGLLHPATDHEVHLVSRRILTLPPEPDPPHRCSNPSKLSPSRKWLSPSPRIFPRHWGPYPLAIRSTSSRRTWSRGSLRVFSIEKSVAPGRCCHLPFARCFLGLFSEL